MSYTVADLVDDTIQHLMGTTREQLNVLANNLEVQAVNYIDTVNLTYGLQGAVPGAYLSIDDETVFILATSPSAFTCTVLRGQKDSLIAAHTSGTIVVVDPPWPRYTVMKTLQDEIRSWGPQVYQVQATELQTTSNIRGYDLGWIGPFYRIIDVLMTPPPMIGSPDYVVYAGNVTSDLSWPSVPFHVLQNAPYSSFPSGRALILDGSPNGIVVPGTLHVIYAAPFYVDVWDDPTDLVGTCGLDPADLDIAPYGAAWRLLSFREVRRTFTQLQGEPRDATEVPALAILQAAQGFKALRDSRLNDAEWRLANRFPLRMSVF